MMDWIIKGIIAILILVLQHFLSTRKSVLWGGILPASYIVFIIYLKQTGAFVDNTKDFWFVSILGTTILLSGWTGGREARKKRQEKELEKIKSHDLN